MVLCAPAPVPTFFQSPEKGGKVMSSVVHFEIPADDVERAKKFYGELFGWKIEKINDPTPMEYWVVMTGRPEGTNAIDGGMLKRQMPGQHVTIYVDVPSIDESTGKVKKLGGQVIVPKTAIPGMGYFAVCLDQEDNGFGLWQNDANAK
jgi:predicted enzyme related to lactoylglutathione lyase